MTMDLNTGNAFASNPAAATPATLEQVRDLLFGAHFRELDRKIGRLAGEMDELRKEMHRRLDVLEAHVKRESQALVARFESESEAHADAMGGIERRFTKMGDGLAHAERELRQQILDQAKGFFEELQRTRDEVVASLARDLALPESDLRGGHERTNASGH